MASPLELVKRANARAEELLARPRLDWAVQKNWAGDTVEILESIYGPKHRKVEVFRTAGEPGVDMHPLDLLHRGPVDPTRNVKNRIKAQVTVLQEFARELAKAETDSAPSPFTDAAKARLWHVLNDLFPATQYDAMGEPVTMYHEDLEAFLHRQLDTVQLAPGHRAADRLQSFILTCPRDRIRSTSF